MSELPASPPLLEGEIARLVDEQLELAVAKLPALSPSGVHPSPLDHEESPVPHVSMEDLLLGNAQASAEMLDEWGALQAAPQLSDEELARQALAIGEGAAAAPEGG
jgi:hypothetical protein